MPSFEAHAAAVARNQAAILHLLTGGDEYLPWVVTVAFYKALHVVEAVLATQPQGEVQHADDHSFRNRLLKTERRYLHLWKNYRPLYEASLIARYLQLDGNSPVVDVFANYLPRPKVESTILGHYLKQVQNSASTLLQPSGRSLPA